ncbi:energy transducer TonB [Acetobacteraceae bacterium]|nr:energy transducer TonB [Acetobacteraceae bacterium]
MKLKIIGTILLFALPPSYATAAIVSSVLHSNSPIDLALFGDFKEKLNRAAWIVKTQNNKSSDQNEVQEATDFLSSLGIKSNLGWEIVESSYVPLLDGIKDFKGRQLSWKKMSVVTKWKNSDEGEYRNTCTIVSGAMDKEFSRWRYLTFVPCSEKESQIAVGKIEVKPNTSKLSNSKSANNPFASLSDVSFDGDPSDMRHKKGQKGGNKGAIDYGRMGPFSGNGKLGTPYISSTTIKGVSSGYGAELDTWIREHISYPDDAVRQEMEGASAVHVRLDRKGNVQQVFIKGSSGYGTLDMATVSIFKDQKLPDVPEDMKGDHFDIDIQVNYLLVRH